MVGGAELLPEPHPAASSPVAARISARVVTSPDSLGRATILGA
jgi:hypothetical protein